MKVWYENVRIKFGGKRKAAIAVKAKQRCKRSQLLVQDQTEPYMEKLLHKGVQSSHREKGDCSSQAGTQPQTSAGGVINRQTGTQQNWVNTDAEETISSKNGSLESSVGSDPRLNPLGSCIMAVQDPSLQGDV